MGVGKHPIPTLFQRSRINPITEIKNTDLGALLFLSNENIYLDIYLFGGKAEDGRLIFKRSSGFSRDMVLFEFFKNPHIKCMCPAYFRCRYPACFYPSSKGDGCTPRYSAASLRLNGLFAISSCHAFISRASGTS